MLREIVGFVEDEVGDWVALLSCHHRQHVRHQPPFRMNEWVLSEPARAERIGTTLDCPLCDRCELPDDLELLRTTAAWDERSMPKALRRAHHIAAGTWGLIRVESGSLRFVAQTDPVTDVTVWAGGAQPIPPVVEHHVEALGPVRFAVEFWGRSVSSP